MREYLEIPLDEGFVSSVEPSCAIFTAIVVILTSTSHYISRKGQQDRLNKDLLPSWAKQWYLPSLIQFTTFPFMYSSAAIFVSQIIYGSPRYLFLLNPRIPCYSLFASPETLALSSMGDLYTHLEPVSPSHIPLFLSSRL